MRKLFVTMGSFSEGFTSVTAGSAAANEKDAKTQKTSVAASTSKHLFIVSSPSFPNAHRYIGCFQYTALLLQQYYGGFKNALHREKAALTPLTDILRCRPRVHGRTRFENKFRAPYCRIRAAGA
jgi:hypothetical protein